MLPKAPLSIRRIPEAHWTKAIYDNWLKFLGGGWLEVWCGTLARQVAQGEEVAVGLNCRTVGGRQFEMDVTLVQSHRLYAISCTTDMKLDRCKSKLFEVAMRARQLGGDLARSALVSLLHGSSSEGLFVDQLRNDVAALWDAPNTPQVFGLDDAREWISGRLQSLENWLKT